MLLTILGLSVALAWINGVQDAPNAITTTIITRSLSARTARMYAAVLNVAGMLIGVAVAAFTHRAVMTALRFPDFIGEAGEFLGPLLLGALVTTIAWNVAAWRAGIPVSGWSSALASLFGAAVAVGVAGVPWFTLGAAYLPIIISPILGGAISFALTRVVVQARSASLLTSTGIRVGHTVSAGLVALAHGASNGRIPVGFIVIALVGVEQGLMEWTLTPVWHLNSTISGSATTWAITVPVAFALGLGTYMSGDRIVFTLGRRLTDLGAAQGLATQSTTAALVWVFSMWLAAPVSSTHTVTGSIIGSAMAISRKNVAWRVCGIIAAWWALTPIVCALVSGLVVTSFAAFVP